MASVREQLIELAVNNERDGNRIREAAKKRGLPEAIIQALHDG